jgi:hypothetical protein
MLRNSNDALLPEDIVCARGLLYDAIQEIDSLDLQIERLLRLRQEQYSRVERFTPTLAFHKNIPPELLGDIFACAMGPIVELRPHKLALSRTIGHVCSQ